jgi:methylenetetrahydrofolate reductase (NADH)
MRYGRATEDAASGRAARPDGSASLRQTLLGQVFVELLRQPRYEVFPLPGIEEAVTTHVPTDVKVAVTSSPARGIEATLALTEELSRRSFDVVPHLAARLVRDDAHLREILGRLEAASVRDVFVVGGDSERPVGKFESTHQLMQAMAERRHPFDQLGIAGYPESHPFIDDESTIQAMFDKEPFAGYLVSQLCLDASVIVGWIDRVRRRGTKLPVHVGIPGVVPRRKLLRIATKIGVGESTRFVRKQGNLVARLLLRGSVSPGRLVDELFPHLDAIAGFHVYTFNELETTERWRLETIERLQTAAAA